MAATLGNPAVVQHDDLVSALDGGQPVRHRHHGDTAVQRGQRLLHPRFRLAVDVGGGLVQQQDARCAGQRPGHCDQLFLAHRQARTALAQRGGTALRQAADHRAGAGGVRCGLHLRGAQRPAHGDVVVGAGGQQKRLLRHQAHGADHLGVGQAVDVMAVKTQRAGRCRVKAQQQRQQRTFATAGVAHDADKLAGRDVQVQPVQHRPAGLVAKVQVVDLDMAGADGGADGG